MLYDNALLARAYLHAWQVTGEPLFERVARETLDWALARADARRRGVRLRARRRLRGRRGQVLRVDAREVRDVLGDERRAEAIEHFGMTEQGNFEGANILGAGRRPTRRTATRRAAALYEARARGCGRASTTSA